MVDPNQAVESAMQELDRLRRTLRRGSGAQVRSADERAFVKATSLAWFNSHRPEVRNVISEDLLEPPDSSYKALLSSADRATSRTRYDSLLKVLREQLGEIRTYVVSPPALPTATGDQPPSFTSLVPAPAMQAVLERRWRECGRCVAAGAPLAATVMMGGLLEALLLARVHRQNDKRAVFGAAAAPKHPTTGKVLPLQEWTLRSYIDVGHELGWITRSAKDVGEVVRDYRNYIHPHKELSHGVNLTDADAALFWEIAKSIARQVLAP